MPFNGSGSFTLVAGNPVVTGTVISSTVQNNTTSDFATGFTNCVTRDGQSAALANIPMGGYKHTGAASGSATGEYLTYGQTSASLSSLTVGTFTATGNANVNGNVTIGDAPTDTLTVNPNAVTWATPVTHSNAHTWSGVQTYSADPAGRVVGASWTPTFTNQSNTSGANAIRPWKYIRVGSTVSFAGIVYFTITSSSTSTRLRVSLPVASAFASSDDAVGTSIASLTTASGMPSPAIYAHVATGTLLIDSTSGSSSAGVAMTVWVTGQYEVI